MTGLESEGGVDPDQMAVGAGADWGVVDSRRSLGLGSVLGRGLGLDRAAEAVDGEVDHVREVGPVGRLSDWAGRQDKAVETASRVAEDKVVGRKAILHAAPDEVDRTRPLEVIEHTLDTARRRRAE